MKKIYIVILVPFFIASCNKKSENKESNLDPIAANKTAIDQSEGYTLFKNNCYVCHSVTSKSHDEIIAPPMVAVKRRYQRSYNSKESFVDAVVSWTKDPKEENGLMRDAIKQFKAMPKQAFKEGDLVKIAAYIYDNEIERPEWFETHFKNEHGGEGKGMGNGKGRGQGQGMRMQGQNNWLQQMSLDGDKKWEANIETTQGIEKLIAILNNDKSHSVDDFKNLEKTLSDEITTIFDKCTMKGASHDNLHTFLLPLINKVDKLKVINSVNEGKLMSSNISSHLNEYKNFFN